MKFKIIKEGNSFTVKVKGWFLWSYLSYVGQQMTPYLIIPAYFGSEEEAIKTARKYVESKRRNKPIEKIVKID